jgi:hypothetical protein
MIEFIVRDARYEEVDVVAEMTRRMILEMEQDGGRKATKDESSWERATLRLPSFTGSLLKWLLKSRMLRIAGARLLLHLVPPT